MGTASARAKLISRSLLALVFIGSGVNHFVNADFYLAMMPPYVPAHAAMVAISGVIEVLLGALILVEKTRALAAWGLVALLVAVFPANVHMALHADQYASFAPAIALWLRLPLQPLMMWWATKNRT